ncbi:hypothetical protein FACI_IFERC00001G1125 [Ferroplasma acidarmanus Fer1]|jgi:hypothetical protein|uniref:Uncharacterized protein n=1 Tax=Ferroplasma acidarmanus Fer1 TaxID=333146 RepID=S0ASP1_FERAC|nr:hypothetical protein FACI_IFERC00001G1125 [Ferroplasma acidarmanus Fer1]
MEQFTCKGYKTYKLTITICFDYNTSIKVIHMAKIDIGSIKYMA